MQVKQKRIDLRIVCYMEIPFHLHDNHKELSTHPLVAYLLDLTERQSIEIEQLKAEIRLLKGHSAKPVIPPNSNLENSRNCSSDDEVKKNSF